MVLIKVKGDGGPAWGKGSRGAEELADPEAANVRGTDRVASRRREVRDLERRDPLRARIIHALGAAPSNPSALASELGAALPTISRHLRALRDAGLVDDERVFGDGRQRRYSLTAAGQLQLKQHRAFGEPQPEPPPVADEVASDFLRSALDGAVEMRRKTNQLADVAARLRTVLSQAERSGLADLALDATAELAITLRQDRKTDQVTELIEALDRIALGQDTRYGRELVTPAAAHRDYTLGRVADAADGEDALSVRAMHLVNAAMSYQRLAGAAALDSANGWRQRQAWSVASLARNLSQQSLFEEALEHAGLALSLFEDLGDAYGQSYCLFLLGFCWRLLGDFDEAWQRLQAAHEMATREGFERFEADTLMQMGEVRRCQGIVVDARRLLEQALGRARELDVPVTMAFSHSALGAVEFQEGRYDEARTALREAHQLFEQCGHREGLALNARRRATVAREQLPPRRSLSDYLKAHHLISNATDLYRTLGSPPGLAACHIEHARLHIKRGDDASKEIAAIKAQLDGERGLLGRDLWLPYMLVSFASEVHDDALNEGARQLVGEVRRRCAERALPSAPRATVAPEIDPEVEALETFQAEGGWFEMGGETRLAASRSTPAKALAGVAFA